MLVQRPLVWLLYIPMVLTGAVGNGLIIFLWFRLAILSLLDSEKIDLTFDLDLWLNNSFVFY